MDEKKDKLLARARTKEKLLGFVYRDADREKE
jgi:hypothetical protein